MHIAFTPDIESEHYILNENESKHCIKVLRLSTSDTIQLLDGRGGFYTAAITAPHHKRCEVKILQKTENYGKRPFYLHIAIAPLKNTQRFETFLEKAVEIGIDEITPLLSFHSERKKLKNERFERIIVAAMKQSVKAYQPVLNAPVDFEALVQRNTNAQKLIAHCAESPEKYPMNKVYQAGNNVLILIGPEGDFSSAEIALARRLGFQEVSLSTSRLRTETAGIAACYAANFMNTV